MAFAITIHEFAHGYVAYKLGDPTAKYLGRLSFNPLVHIDLFGTILLPLTMVTLGLPPLGWAKPVPINFSSLKNPKRDMLWVGIAGPCANLLIAILFAGIIKLPFVKENAIYVQLLSLSVILNLVLGVFNIIPIPPLDGSRILISLLPLRYAYIYSFVESYGFLIIFLLLWMGALRNVIGPIVTALARLLQVDFSLSG